MMAEKMESKEHTRIDGSTCSLFHSHFSLQFDNKVLFYCLMFRKRSLLAVQTSGHEVVAMAPLMLLLLLFLRQFVFVLVASAAAAADYDDGDDF